MILAWSLLAVAALMNIAQAWLLNQSLDLNRDMLKMLHDQDKLLAETKSVAEDYKRAADKAIQLAQTAIRQRTQEVGIQ